MTTEYAAAPVLPLRRPYRLVLAREAGVVSPRTVNWCGPLDCSGWTFPMRQVVVPEPGEAGRNARCRTSSTGSGTPKLKLDTTDATPRRDDRANSYSEISRSLHSRHVAVMKGRVRDSMDEDPPWSGPGEAGTVQIPRWLLPINRLGLQLPLIALSDHGRPPVPQPSCPLEMTPGLGMGPISGEHHCSAFGTSRGAGPAWVANSSSGDPLSASVKTG